MVERPVKNFMNLILFPNQSIFVSSKDVDDESSEENEDEAE